MKELIYSYIFTAVVFIVYAIYAESKAEKYRVKVPTHAPILFGVGVGLLIAVLGFFLL